MNTTSQQALSSSSFYGAAFIDPQGREIPITEEMIQQACDSLEAGWHYPANTAPQANGKR